MQVWVMNRLLSRNDFSFNFISLHIFFAWCRWAIVYLAQMKPLIVPILSEGEWSSLWGKLSLQCRLWLVAIRHHFPNRCWQGLLSFVSVSLCRVVFQPLDCVFFFNVLNSIAGKPLGTEIFSTEDPASFKWCHLCQIWPHILKNVQFEFILFYFAETDRNEQIHTYVSRNHPLCVDSTFTVWNLCASHVPHIYNNVVIFLDIWDNNILAGQILIVIKRLNLQYPKTLHTSITRHFQAQNYTKVSFTGTEIQTLARDLVVIKFPEHYQSFSN